MTNFHHGPDHLPCMVVWAHLICRWRKSPILESSVGSRGEFMAGELVIVNWLKQKAREGRAREDGDRIIFYVPLPARLFMASGTFVLIVVEIVTASVPDFPLWQKTALLPIIFLLLWHWPNAVILSSTGISKRNFLGIPRTIPWHDVRTFDLAARKQQAHVGQGTGLRIAFSAFHVDLRRFVEEIRRRAPGVTFTSDL